MEENLREVYSAQKTYKISIIQELLSENKINSFVLNQKDSSLPIGSIKLYVDEKDEAKAREIIKAHEM